VAQTATGPLWFPAVFFKDRSLTLDMARRAEEAGLLRPVPDAGCQGQAQAGTQHTQQLCRPSLAQLCPSGRDRQYWSFGLDGPTGTNDLRDPASTWEDLDWLAANTRLPSWSRASWWVRTAGMPPTTALEA